MANARAIEPVEVAAQRKQQHREHMANARATEPVEVATQRKQQNREHMANPRAKMQELKWHFMQLFTK